MVRIIYYNWQYLHTKRSFTNMTDLKLCIECKRANKHFRFLKKIINSPNSSKKAPHPSQHKSFRMKHLKNQLDRFLYITVPCN